jgi:hypothetical protein
LSTLLSLVVRQVERFTVAAVVQAALELEPG